MTGAVAATPAAASEFTRYSVEHETCYSYRVPVAQSWQLAHLTRVVILEVGR